MTVLGYVVVGDTAYELGADGILWISTAVTLFPDRRSAQRAITRTIAYAAARGLTWETQRMCVRRVVAAPKEGPSA